MKHPMSEELRTFAKSERQFCFHPYAGALERAADELDRLHSMTAWRPMETAPTDGTRILLCDKHGCRDIAWWTFECDSGAHQPIKPGWQVDACEDDRWYARAFADPTGWLPLPEKQ